MPAQQPHLLTLVNDLAEISRVAASFEAWAEPLDIPMPDLMALQLALEETITNVIHHGYRDAPSGSRRFTVEFSAPAESPPRIRLVITDDAPAYDPLARPEVDTSLPLEDRPVGGLGVHLVKNLMPRAAYARHDDHNILTLERELSRPGDSLPGP